MSLEKNWWQVGRFNKPFRMVGNTERKIHISSWEEFLDHKVCKQGNKLLRG